jgi:superoxide dismutase, Cu-Zn family
LRIPTVLGAALIAATALPAYAGDIMINMYAISGAGVGKPIGKIRAVDSTEGLLLVPSLHLPDAKAGQHGFHLHEHPSCGNKGPDGKTGAGLAAGGHFDPGHTGHHEGPNGKGHLGDLPSLAFDAGGNAYTAVTAPRLKVEDLWGHALVIHAGGDNYADNPPLGGGGARIACGVIARGKPAAKAKP